MYLITFTLDDKKDQVQVPFSLFINDPPIVVVPPAAAAIVEKPLDPVSPNTE